MRFLAWSVSGVVAVGAASAAIATWPRVSPVPFGSSGQETSTGPESVRLALDRYDPVAERLPLARVQCDVSAWHERYFGVVEDPERLERLRRKLVEYRPAWRGIEDLLLPSRHGSPGWAPVGRVTWDGKAPLQFTVTGDVATLELARPESTGSTRLELTVDGQAVALAGGCEAGRVGRLVWDLRAYQQRPASLRWTSPAPVRHPADVTQWRSSAAAQNGGCLDE